MKLENLLSDSVIAFYWIGFILADGTFNKRRLKVTLQEKDIKHLRSLKNFLQFPLKIRNEKNRGRIYKTLAIADTKNILKIKNKFDIRDKKTYNPPLFDLYYNFTDNQFLALLIGYIDGDGYIGKQSNGRKDSQIQLKCHGSWLNFYDGIRLKLENMYDCKIPKARINKHGYAMLGFSRMEVVRGLKQKVIELSLPVLTRKWSRINHNYITKFEKYKQLKPKLLELQKRGFSKRHIAKLLKVKSIRLVK